MSDIINWGAALFFAGGGLALLIAKVSDVCEMTIDGVALDDAVHFHATEILMSAASLGLGVHFILHLTGAYR